MNEAFKKLCTKIEYKIDENFKNVNIVNAKLIDDEYFILSFNSLRFIPIESMELFLDKLHKNFGYKFKLEFNIENKVYSEKLVINYLQMIIKKIIRNEYLIKNLDKAKISLNDFNLIIESPDVITNTKLKSNIEKIKKSLYIFGFSDLVVKIKQVKADSSILDSMQKDILDENRNYSMRLSNNTETIKKEINYKNSGYKKVDISNLDEEGYENVIITGKIFKIVHRKTRSGMIVTTLSITDFKNAIYVKVFSSSDKQKQELDNYKEEQYVEISGRYQLDSYTQEKNILARKIIILSHNENIKMDNSTQKRVELSIRTKMSTMDGIQTPLDFIKRAKEWNHKAIAIIDEDSVQAFPDYFYAAKDSGVKPIYGASLNVVDRESLLIRNPHDRNLLNDTYIVFDLETTGLSPEYNEIIEFGAIKVINGAIIERKQFFIKPIKKIPKIITEITSITDSDVADAKPENEAMQDIINYCKNYTLVAHNATFDITFLNTKLEKYGYKKLNNPVIDTLVAARLILFYLKRFPLQRVAKRFGIIYDSAVAHRADYDAEVLAKIWIKMIEKLKEEHSITNQVELSKAINNTIEERKFTKNVTIIAKNQDGLKELFLYTTQGLTKDFSRTPRIFFDTLKHRKNILLGSGSLKSVLVDKMLYSSKKEVISEISKYDYIEVQPLKNYVHIINRGFDKEDLKDMIKFVIFEAKKQNKIVVATGDVRYLDPRDKIYHDVYINAKGLGGVRHYLYKFNEKEKIYPIQNFLTTSEMIEEFNFLNDINLINEIVIENTNKIADLIDDNIQVIKKDLYTPKLGNSDDELVNLVYVNARKRYGENLPTIIENRIKRELDSIIEHGYGIIYWISHKLVAKSLKDGYLVGSRGSVGSSIVATFSEITEVNPLPPHYVCSQCQSSIFNENNNTLNSGYDLPIKKCEKCNINYDREGQNIPFETFLGFEAEKVPDIDLNFSGDYQPIIHNEVKKIFGDKHAFRAGTISTVAEKTAYGYVLAWAEDNEIKLSKAFIEFIAKGVTGTKRTTGQHPGGIIVIPKEYDVEDFTPINFPANDSNSAWKTTHFDFHAIHDNVLKLDLLGHDDPTAIRTLEKFTGINAKKDISFSDEKIISLFSSTKELGINPEDIGGETTGAMGIPEFGTTFVRGMLKNAKVKSFGDLISLSGLSHGTDVWTGNAETIIKERGLSLNDIISCRDNIMIDLINKGLEPSLSFTIMEKVRKGKGVSEVEEKEMKKVNVEDWYIDSLKKIKYMFPKAHATAYVMMAWRIAWFKLYYPLAYYATYFTTRSDVFDIETIAKGKEKIMERYKGFKSRLNYKIGELKLTNKEVSLIPIYEIALESIARGVNISNVDLWKSKATNWYYNEKEKTLIPPFTSIDGLGIAVAISIVKARKEKEFSSVEDLSKRSQINKTQVIYFNDNEITKGLSKTNQISLF